MNLKSLSCWVVTEGMIGTQNQCLGVAEALGLIPTIKQITLTQPWKALSPWLGCEMACTFQPRLNTPWPDLVIASGRKSVAASRYIKRKSGGKTFTVQIQDPKCNPNDFDLVAVPNHDLLRGANVIVTHGAPNRLSPEKLDAAKTQFAPQFKSIKKPRIAVLLGGNSRTHKITPFIMQKLVAQLKTLKGGLMVTASRRTGEENLEILQSGLAGTDAYIWDSAGDNPYFGMLAYADHILVSADSVSMLCDAGTTGKPVHMINLDGGSPRFERFHHHLQDVGVIRPFTPDNKGNLESWSYDPLKDAQLIAEAIQAAMQKRYG